MSSFLITHVLTFLCLLPISHINHSLLPFFFFFFHLLSALKFNFVDVFMFLLQLSTTSFSFKASIQVVSPAWAEFSFTAEAHQSAFYCGGWTGWVSNKDEPVDFREELDCSHKAGVDDCPCRRWEQGNRVFCLERHRQSRHLGYLPSDKVSLCWLSLCLWVCNSSWITGVNIFDS